MMIVREDGHWVAKVTVYDRADMAYSSVGRTVTVPLSEADELTMFEIAQRVAASTPWQKA